MEPTLEDLRTTIKTLEKLMGTCMDSALFQSMAISTGHAASIMDCALGKETARAVAESNANRWPPPPPLFKDATKAANGFKPGTIIDKEA